MRTFLKKYIWIIAGILLIILLFTKINLFPSIKNFFKSQPVVIEPTPIIIQEIKSLANLITVVFTDEVVMDSAQIGKSLPSFLPIDIGATLLPSVKKLVIIGRGKVVAGTDLSGMKNSDVSVIDDSVHLIIPHAIILQTILNPSDYETFIEEGKWSEEEVTALKIKIRNKISSQAIAENIPGKADARSKIILENYLMNTGFKKVSITFF